MKTNPIIQRRLKVLLVVLSIAALIGVTCFLFYKIIERPQFIELDIPSPEKTAQHGDWSYTEYTTRILTYSHSRYFIWRRETRVYETSSPAKYHFNSWGNVVDYFDNWLQNNGWEVSDSGACNSVLPESTFLNQGEGGYLAYRQSNSNPHVNEPTVCLAVWKTSSEKSLGFRIVLLTSNPSIFTRFSSEFR